MSGWPAEVILGMTLRLNMDDQRNYRMKMNSELLKEIRRKQYCAANQECKNSVVGTCDEDGGLE